jgi:hypothetical protein
VKKNILADMSDQYGLKELLSFSFINKQQYEIPSKSTYNINMSTALTFDALD